MECSVVLPVYNKKERLSASLNALLNQDYNDNYEIIIVDDGSTDGSIDFLNKISDRVKIIRQTNKGAAVARYIGILHSRAPIIVFQDADDIAAPNKIKTLVGCLKKQPEAVASFANTEVLNGKPLPRLEHESLVPVGESFLIEKPYDLILQRFLPISMAMNLAGRREFLLKATVDRGFFKAANDFDLQLRLSSHGPFVYVNNVTNYYHRGEGISSTWGGRQTVFKLLSVHDYLKSADIDLALLEVVKRNISISLPESLIECCCKKDVQLFYKLLPLIRHIDNKPFFLKQLLWVFNDSLMRSR